MTNTSLANIPPSDNFALAAEGSQVSSIVGERVRFSKGRFLVGRGDGAQLAIGTQLQALDIQAAWIKFVDGRVVDQRVGFPLVERGELDDNDPDEWPAGYDGEPADPWVNQRLLYLIDPQNGAEFTFTTSSWGGRAAVEQLARQVYVKRQAVPGAIAIIKLEADFKKSQKYGAIACPKFAIAGWVGDKPTDATPRPPSSRPAARFDLDDEIPF